MYKSYEIRVPLAGPPAPQAWWSYAANNGGSPVVIRRKLGYVVTALNQLAHWERVMAEESAKSEIDRHPRALKNLSVRVENARDWFEYSAQVLRNCVRFALARIEDGEDRATLITRREQKAREEVATWSEEDQKLAAQVIFGCRRVKNLAPEWGLTADEMRSKIKSLRNRLSVEPYSREPGRHNVKFHEELRYYARVLDSYLLAKKAVAGCSDSDEAMRSIQDMLRATVAVHTRRSGREQEDAEQQAALGILEACKEYTPGKDGKFAQLASYAQWKILRSTQVRKASHCKPGTTMIQGKVTSTGALEPRTDEDGRPDGYHPVAAEENEAVKMDVRQALAALPEDERELIELIVQGGEKLHDVAEAKGTTIAKIRVKLSRAKEKLARMLSAHA